MCVTSAAVVADRKQCDQRAYSRIEQKKISGHRGAGTLRVRNFCVVTMIAAKLVGRSQSGSNMKRLVKLYSVIAHPMSEENSNIKIHSCIGTVHKIGKKERRTITVVAQQTETKSHISTPHSISSIAQDFLFVLLFDTRLVPATDLSPRS